jgi:D-amino peptidase
MFNLRPAELDRRARVLQGQKAWSMVEGAGPDLGFGVALFVGYHARAGHPRGTIAHTYSGRPTETRLNGRLVGETGINAAVLGAWGLPVGLVTGDDALAEEVADWLPWAERVVVKDAAGGSSAASLHPAAAADLIEEGAADGRAAGDGGGIRAAAPRGRAAGRHRGRLRERRLRRLRGDRARRGTDRRPRSPDRGS